MVAAGSHDVMIRKAEFDAAAEDSVLAQIKRASVMCGADPGQTWTLADYVANFGDPLHKGKGKQAHPA